MEYNGIRISDYNSYSLAKRFDEEGPSGLINTRKKSNKGMSLGSLTDDYIYLEKEEFYDKYVTTPITLPPAVITLAYRVAKEFKEENIDKISGNEALQKEVIRLIKEEGLFANIKKEETFIKKFDTPSFYEYTKLLYLNKKIVPIKEFIKVQELKGSLYSNEKSKHLFLNDHENLSQLEVKFLYKGMKTKCYLDQVIIDHEKKEIQGIDLKTGAVNPEDFFSSFFKFKYYLQAAIYQEALKDYNKERFNGEYTIKNFKFLYISGFYPDIPVVYKVSEKWISAALKGFYTTSGYYYKGFDQLIDEIAWHKEKLIFNMSRDFYENKEMDIKDDFISIDE